MAAEGMMKKIKGLFRRTDGQSGNFDENLKEPGRWSNSKRRMVFQLSTKKSLEYGRVLLQERVSLFHGKTNHVPCLSVNDLNTHLHDWIPYSHVSFPYQCVWEGRPVLVKIFQLPNSDFFNGMFIEKFCREIAIATEMGIHKNVHKLLACCLETESAVLIYEYLQNRPLSDKIFASFSRTQLEWKDRLRIASEISDALAFLHTRFPRPIIHRNLKPENVLLDENNAAKLTNFSLCVSIPKGKTCVEPEDLKATTDYIAPEYACHGRLVEKSDVFSFGILFIELLTGERFYKWDREMCIEHDPVVEYGHVLKRVNAYDIAAASQTLDEEEEEEEDHLIREQVLQESTELAVRCMAQEEDSRPTMEEVATQLKNIITISLKNAYIVQRLSQKCMKIKDLAITYLPSPLKEFSNDILQSHKSQR